MSNFSFAETEFKDVFFLVFVTFVGILLRDGEFVAILGFNWLFDHFKNFANHNGQMGGPLQWLTLPQEGSSHQGTSVATCSSSAYWKSLMTTVQFCF